MREPRTLGFIGLGTMGGRMCRNLATRSGLPVMGYDIDSARVAALAADGVTAAEDVASLVRASDVVFLCLPGEPDIRAVGLGPDGVVANATAGQVVVDMTTATAAVARELAAALAEREVDFADAPVAKGVPSAEDGTLSIMVGGSEAVFEHLSPLLGCMGTDLSHCGDVGTGQVVKLMNNMMIFQTVSALSEALAIGTRSGVDGQRLFEILSRGSGDSFALRRHGACMARGEYPDDVFPTVYSLKDLRYALELAADVGVDAAGARLVERRFEQAIERGLGKYYSPVIYRLFEE
jgi:3-hydroxyisobutyrate dehydrogenase-like beta-hydroxyacid dehydrogenase